MAAVALRRAGPWVGHVVICQEMRFHRPSPSAPVSIPPPNTRSRIGATV
jgi:hypothetical protein